jgi:formylglycine-generating enzyme required for sulfatase activity
MKKIIAIHGLLLLAFFLLGCGEDQPDKPFIPTPTPITSNADWEPFVRPLENGEMLLVPAGCFTMGHEDGRRDERPVQEVCFNEAFWIDRYEVTNAQFGERGAFAGDTRPRENLTWYEARDYCASRGVRLPTEAEWEYAARGPDSLIYPWGNELINDNLWFDQNWNAETTNVGSYPNGVSWVGAYDMAGNVWEWTSSLYRPYPYNANDGREDPNDTANLRVYRGGLGSYVDYGVSSAKRFRAFPDYRDWFIGFRCAGDD